MMYLWELTRQILREMRLRKLRSLLALFGIVWGTIAVVVLLALGQGFYQASRSSMMDMVDKTLFIYPGSTTQPFHGLPMGRRISIKVSDVDLLPTIIPDIQRISAILKKNDNKISWHNRFRNRKSILGVAADYAILRVTHAAPGGRFINTFDIKEKRRVIFLGNRFKERFFGNVDPIGKELLVNGIRFTIIGVRQGKTQNQNVFDSDEHNLFIPYSTFIALWGDKDIENMLVLPQDNIDTALLKNKLNQYFSHRFQYAPDDSGAIHMIDLAEGFKFFNSFFLSIQLFLGFCGCMTLAVGGIGVANIMFLIVTERTAEIGLRMALGAKPIHILQQILLESAVIVALGGILGLMISFSIIKTIALLPLPTWLGQPAIIPESVTITVGILALVALSAGFFPARRAALMPPVKALAF